MASRSALRSCCSARLGSTPSPAPPAAAAGALLLLPAGAACSAGSVTAVIAPLLSAGCCRNHEGSVCLASIRPCMHAVTAANGGCTCVYVTSAASCTFDGMMVWHPGGACRLTYEGSRMLHTRTMHGANAPLCIPSWAPGTGRSLGGHSGSFPFFPAASALPTARWRSMLRMHGAAQRRPRLTLRCGGRAGWPPRCAVGCGGTSISPSRCMHGTHACMWR